MLALQSYGYIPLGIDIKPSTRTDALQGSITDRPFIRDLLASRPTIQHIIHAATLHKPHVGSHTKEDFISTNITGTLVLLEEAAARHPQQVKSFVFVSTTSTFGAALSPAPGEPAAWIDEAVAPVPKNIYGATKAAAEDICRLVHMQRGLPAVVLRTSRFFPEEDDDDARRAAMDGDNLKVCELAYRRVDIADAVAACVCALRKAAAGEVRWGTYIVSAPTPFARDEETLGLLNGDDEQGAVGALMERCVPGCGDILAQRGWTHLSRIDRVYDSSKAVRELGWEPEFTFQACIGKLSRGEDWRSELTRAVGKRGYHDVPTGVYTVK
ncbi:putative nad dependent epimerase dehydratase family protein [Diaporthe ampelina]|uniref:Putative nad dependent epimerase dehydratase family protein n=1 Tax=Diaporthe ampelina TaxID=1214573 RepID=A0A0G2I6W7_9PEZI|nr:putative nad dependent epimerase dehydratase family protein [Diaporthe ampelina]